MYRYGISVGRIWGCPHLDRSGIFVNSRFVKKSELWSQKLWCCSRSRFLHSGFISVRTYTCMSMKKAELKKCFNISRPFIIDQRWDFLRLEKANRYYRNQYRILYKPKLDPDPIMVFQFKKSPATLHFRCTGTGMSRSRPEPEPCWINCTWNISYEYIARSQYC